MHAKAKYKTFFCYGSSCYEGRNGFQVLEIKYFKFWERLPTVEVGAKIPISFKMQFAQNTQVLYNMEVYCVHRLQRLELQGVFLESLFSHVCCKYNPGFH